MHECIVSINRFMKKMKKMAKNRIAVFYQICVVAICCHFASTTSQIDCEKLKNGIKLIHQLIENRQIILNCSVTGSIKQNHMIMNFQFNNNPSYSCNTTTKAPNHSTNTPYARLLDDETTCQLIIPNATTTDYRKYQCQVIITHTQQKEGSCFLQSKEITIQNPYKEFTTILNGEFSTTPPSEESLSTMIHSKAAQATTPEETSINENDRSNHVTKTEIFSIGGIILASLLAIIVILLVVTAVNYRFRRKPRIEDQENNAEHLPNVIRQGEEGRRDHAIQASDSGSGQEIDPAQANVVILND